MKKKHKHKNKKNKKNTILLIIAIIILILIVKIMFKSRDVRNDFTNILIDNNNITSSLTNEIKIKEDIVYMSINDIKQYIDETIYREDETDTIIMTSDKKLSSIKIEEESVMINGTKMDIYCSPFEENGIIYLPISEMENVYDIDLQYNEETDIITIDFLFNKLEKAYVSKNVNVKEENKKISKNIEKIKKGNWVIYISEENGKAKIRTQNGNIGYIKKKYLNNFILERENMSLEEYEREGDFLEYDIQNDDISTYEKRLKIINTIWTKAINKDIMKVKINNCYNKNNIERFKIEIVPFLKESGIYTMIN